MKTLFLSSLISFCLLIFLLNKRHSKMEKNMKEAFWKREEEANHTRRKSLDRLPYITIPLDELPLSCPAHAKGHLPAETGNSSAEAVNAEAANAEDESSRDAALTDCLDIIRSLSTQKIVNFTGYTNTDLKLAYGTANITCLSEYDQNYTLLVSTLQKWAEILYRADCKKECRQVLEYAVSIGTDVSRTYFLLADLYDETSESERKTELLEKASALPSLSSKVIVRTLQESGPYSGWLHSGSDVPPNILP